MDLPATWANAPLGELIAHDGMFTDGDWVESKDQDPSGSVRLIQLADIGDSRFVSKSSRFLTREKADELNCTFLKKGDLLVARMPDPLGRCCLFPLEGEERFVTVVDVCALRLGSASIEPRYLMWAINSPTVRGMIAALQSGSTRKRISRGNLATVPIPIPPLNEQRRIVEKIEARFDEIDKGVESLKTAKTNLGLYRQSLLKSAFEGRLTADWRARNADKLEAPETLVARIQAEREIRYKAAIDDWQKALTTWRAGGEKGKKPAKPKRPPDLASVTQEELALLPDVPSEWSYTKLANLGDLGRGKSKHRPRNDKRLFGGQYPFIQTGEVKAAGRYVKEHQATYSEFGLEQSKLWPAGTLCITIAANIAETAFLTFDACFPDSVVGFATFEEIITPKFVELFIKSARVNIEAYAPATAQKNINLNTLETLVIPFCGQAEQAEIVRILDARLDAADALEAEIDAALTRASALRQSILKKAFSGQLVPQDAADEPASALLERIRAERAKAPKTRTRRVQA